MMNSKQSQNTVAVFVFQAVFPHSNSLAQLVISFAERQQVFKAREITKNWYVACVSLPNGRIRTGFTYYARKHTLETNNKGENTIVNVDEEIMGSFKRGYPGKCQVYIWQFGKEKSYHEVALHSANVAINVCSKAPTSSQIMVYLSKEDSLEDKNRLLDTVKLQKGTYLSIVPVDHLHNQAYLWVNLKLDTNGDPVIKLESRSQFRHIPKMADGEHYLYKADVWGKTSMAYTCQEHHHINDEFLKYIQSIGRVYKRRHEVYTAPDEFIIMEKRCRIEEEIEVPITPRESGSTEARDGRFHDNQMAQKQSALNNLSKVTTYFGRALAKFFRSKFFPASNQRFA